MIINHNCLLNVITQIIRVDIRTILLLIYLFLSSVVTTPLMPLFNSKRGFAQNVHFSSDGLDYFLKMCVCVGRGLLQMSRLPTQPLQYSLPSRGGKCFT